MYARLCITLNCAGVEVAHRTRLEGLSISDLWDSGGALHWSHSLSLRVADLAGVPNTWGTNQFYWDPLTRRPDWPSMADLRPDPVTIQDSLATWHFGLLGLEFGHYSETLLPTRKVPSHSPYNTDTFVIVPFWMLLLPFALATYWAFTKLRTGRWFHPWEETRQLAGWVAGVGRGIVRHRRGLGIGVGAGCGVLAILFVIFHWPMFFGPPVGARLQAALAEAARKPGHGVVFSPVPSRQVWVPGGAGAGEGHGLRLAVAGWSSVLPAGTRTILWRGEFDHLGTRHPKVYYRLNGRWREAAPEAPAGEGRLGAGHPRVRTGPLLTVFIPDRLPGDQKFRLPAQATEVRLIPAKGNPLLEGDIAVSGPAWRLSWGRAYPQVYPTGPWDALGYISSATINVLRRAIRGSVAFPWLRREGPVTAQLNHLGPMHTSLGLARAMFAADGRKLAQVGNLDKALDIALLSSCRRPARVYWCHAARGGVFCTFPVSPGRHRWVVWWFDPKGRCVENGSVQLLGKVGRIGGQIPRRLARFAVPFFRQMPPIFSFYGRFGASRQEPWRVPPAVFGRGPPIAGHGFAATKSLRGGQPTSGRLGAHYDRRNRQ